MTIAGWPGVALFDLDGTLIDSAPDLAASVNIVLAARGHAKLSLERVKGMIGNGVRKLVERAFEASGDPLDEAGLDLAHDEMMRVYGDHLTVLTTLMPGVVEALETLKAAGVRIAVVTNKPQMPTEAILLHFGLGAYVDVAIGGDAGIEKKPAPDMLLSAIDRLGASPQDAAMIGDSPADLESARAAGIPVVLVRGGYTTRPVETLGADIVLDTLADVPDALARLRG